MTLWKWSKTAASNSNADSTINWAEGQAPSSVNDSSRAEMAAVAKYRDDTAGTAITSTGSSNAYVVATNQNLTTLTNGFKISFLANMANTGAATLNVDSLGAKPLRSIAGSALESGAIQLNAVYTAAYSSSGDEWILHGRPSPLLLIPSTTKMIFQQTAAPTGWTKITTTDNAALRLVSGTASSGGTANFTSAFAARTIAQGNLPSYNLSSGSLTATMSGINLYARTISSEGAGAVAIVPVAYNTLGSSPDAFASASISVGGSIPSGGSGTAMDFAVKYVDVIVCQKD